MRRLEREQREDPVDGAADRRARRSRRHAQTDGLHEMDRAHAVALQLALEREVEIRRVDADEHRHPIARAAGAQRAADREDFGQPGDDLGECRATDSASSGCHASQPGGLHFRPAIPTKRTCGTRARTASISIAASASPDASPATIPTVTLPERAASPCRPARFRDSADDAACRRGKEIDEWDAAPARPPRQPRALALRVVERDVLRDRASCRRGARPGCPPA